MSWSICRVGRCNGRSGLGAAQDSRVARWPVAPCVTRYHSCDDSEVKSVPHPHEADESVGRKRRFLTRLSISNSSPGLARLHRRLAHLRPEEHRFPARDSGLTAFAPLVGLGVVTPSPLFKTLRELFPTEAQ